MRQRDIDIDRETYYTFRQTNGTDGQAENTDGQTYTQTDRRTDHFKFSASQ